LVGIYTEDDLRDKNEATGLNEIAEEEENIGKDVDENEEDRFQNEVLSFPTNCPECNAPAATNMKVTSK